MIILLGLGLLCIIFVCAVAFFASSMVESDNTTNIINNFDGHFIKRNKKNKNKSRETYYKLENHASLSSILDEHYRKIDDTEEPQDNITIKGRD